MSRIRVLKSFVKLYRSRLPSRSPPIFPVADASLLEIFVIITWIGEDELLSYKFGKEIPRLFNKFSLVGYFVKPTC